MSYNSRPDCHFPFDLEVIQTWFTSAVKIQTAWRSYQQKQILEDIYDQALDPYNSFFKEVDYTETAMKRLEKSLFAVKDSSEKILESLDKQILACQPLPGVVRCSLLDESDEIKEEITEIEVDAEYQMWMSGR